MSNISGFCTQGDSIVPAQDVKKLSRLPIEISPDDPNIIVFPEEKSDQVKKSLLPFGINIIKTTN